MVLVNKPWSTAEVLYFKHKTKYDLLPPTPGCKLPFLIRTLNTVKGVSASRGSERRATLNGAAKCRQFPEHSNQKPEVLKRMQTTSYQFIIGSLGMRLFLSMRDEHKASEFKEWQTQNRTLPAPSPRLKFPIVTLSTILPSFCCCCYCFGHLFI